MGTTMETNSVTLESIELESFQVPEDAQVIAREGEAQMVNVSSIVSVVSHTFRFRENKNTPGRVLEQSVVVSVPSGAGFFTSVPYFMGAFTTSNFQYLTERPLGQFFVSVGLRGNNLICRVRLTDKNSDDPILIEVTAIVVFYR